MQLKIWYRHHDDGQYDAWVGDFESIAAAEEAFADDELFVCATDDLDSEFPPHLVESYDSGTGIYTLKVDGAQVQEWIDAGNAVTMKRKE